MKDSKLTGPYLHKYSELPEYPRKSKTGTNWKGRKYLQEREDCGAVEPSRTSLLYVGYIIEHGDPERQRALQAFQTDSRRFYWNI